jgi:hypothetical protein
MIYTTNRSQLCGSSAIVIKVSIGMEFEAELLVRRGDLPLRGGAVDAELFVERDGFGGGGVGHGQAQCAACLK